MMITQKSKTIYITFTVLVAMSVMVRKASADLIGVSGPDSSLGTAASIISAPALVTNDAVTNTGQQGFNEVQDYITQNPITMDNEVVLEAGSFVDSHMIFFNIPSGTNQSHYNVVWTFSGNILGVMSDQMGNLEAASTPELGAPGTTYDAPWNFRGMESDSYSYTPGTNVLIVNMTVDAAAGDWIRIVTEGTVVPLPAAVLLGILGLSAVGIKLRKFA